MQIWSVSSRREKDKVSMKAIFNLDQKILRRIDSIRYAWSIEPCFRVWTVVGLVLILASIPFGLEALEYGVLVTLWIMGMAFELLNTTIEQLLNLVEPRIDPRVKVVKDAFGSLPAFVFSAFCICWLLFIIL